MYRVRTRAALMFAGLAAAFAASACGGGAAPPAQPTARPAAPAAPTAPPAAASNQFAASPAAASPAASSASPAASPVSVLPTPAIPPDLRGSPVAQGPSKQWSSPPAMQIDTNKTYIATMETTAGSMKIELFPKDAPNTVNNFVFLSREGFYNGTKFHRIIKGFMIQGGDPTGTGGGSPGYRFGDELPKDKNYDRGIIAMANAGPNTQGSQFFVMHANYPLPKNYTIFGRVTDGLDTLDKIANTPVSASRSGEMSNPTQDVRITNVTIEEK